MGKLWKKNAAEMLLAVLCLALWWAGVCRKQGYHMDELLSFELANARFTPWIVPTQPEGRLEKFVKNEIAGDSLGETLGNLRDTLQDVLTNRGSSKMLSYRADVYEEPVWITAEQFRDYITVGKEDAFCYSSVYFNVKDDNHPPLHFMLLHTMSSLFQGNASPMLGCAINLAALAGVLCLLMALGRRFGKALGQEGSGRFLGQMAALLFGLSTGAMATALLIRMYALLTFFCVALFYLHVKKWQEDGFGSRSRLLVFVTACGFWTQYFFLFYCLALAAVTAVLLFRRKKYRELAVYARSMALAGMVGLALFPFAVSDVFSSGRGVEALQNLSMGLSGYWGRLAAFGRILADRTFGFLSWVLLLVAIWTGMELAAGRLLGRRRKVSPLVWMLVWPALCYFGMAARMSPYLVDRYVMPLFPFASLGGVLLIASVLRNRKYAAAVWGLAAIVQAIGCYQYDGTYLYEGYDLQVRAAEEYAESPCICVYDGVGYYENLVEFTRYDKTLLVRENELAGRKDRASIASLSQVVVLAKPGVDWPKIVRVMEETYGFSLVKTLWEGTGVHGDVAGVFGK